MTRSSFGLVLSFTAVVSPILAQAPANRTLLKPASQTKTWTMPHTADGQPDLQGVWSNATTTPLERPTELGDKEFFTAAEAKAWEKRVVDRNSMDQKSVAADVFVAYNDAWYDRGTRTAKTMRTSMIMDPKDGKLPAMTADGKVRAAAAAKERQLHPADGPESRSLTERCLLFGAAGPPMMPGPYNNNYQFVQTKDTVTILIEMIHDTRVIPIAAAGQPRSHLSSNVRLLKGDSIGHWEGNTLVVDTTNFDGRARFRGTSENLHLTERFTRTDAETILYEYSVDDPATYTKPWTAQMTMSHSDSPIYEYACHEGNYGMMGILSGARKEEKQAAK